MGIILIKVLTKKYIFSFIAKVTSSEKQFYRQAYYIVHVPFKNKNTVSQYYPSSFDTVSQC